MSIATPIPRDTRETTLISSAGQKTFGPFDWVLYDDEDVTVAVKGPSETSYAVQAGVTVTPVSTLPGLFSVTLAAAPAAGSSVKVLGTRQPYRDFDVTRGGRVSAPELEREFDRLTIQAQEVLRDYNRMLRVPVGDALAAMPTKAQLKGKVLGFHSETAEPIAFNPTVQQFHFISTAPADSFGANGDAALDGVTGNLYFKSGDAWGLVGNLQGPAGEAGPAGSGAGDVTGAAGGTKTGQWAFFSGPSGKILKAGKIIRPGTLNSNENDYNPSDINDAAIMLLGSDATRNITGITARLDGAPLLVINNGANNIVLKKDDGASSSAVNRFRFTNDITLAPNQGVLLIYNENLSRWMCLYGFGDFQTKLLSDAFAFTGAVSFGGSFGLVGAITPAQITADQNNYNPAGLSTCSRVELDADAARSITGLAALADGQRRIIANVSAFAITLKDADANSTAANRFAFPAGDLVIPPLHQVELIYRAASSRWLALDGFGDFQHRKMSSSFPITGPASFANTLGFLGALTPTQITADQNNYNPASLSTALVLRLSSDATRNLSGLAGGADGRVLIVENVGSQSLNLIDESASSDPANRFALNGDLSVAAKKCAILRYDGTLARWMALARADATGGGGGSVPADLDLLLAQLEMGIADNANVAQFLGNAGNRVADSFDALTYVNVAGATNLDSGTAGLLKNTITAASYSQFSQGLGTTIGNMTAGGGLASAFDGNENQAYLAAAYYGTVGGTGTIGKDWGSGNAYKVGKFTVVGTNDYGLTSGTVSTEVKLQGSNDGSSWTDLYTTTFANVVGGTWTFTSANGINVSTAYRYHRVSIRDTTSAFFNKVAEVKFYDYTPAVTNNVTVKSTVFTAATAPASAKLVARVKFVDAITLGTDLKLSVSRDGGTTWTYATLNDRFTANSIHVIESSAIDVSGQPSGTSVLWRLESFNNKAFELHDIYLYWS